MFRLIYIFLLICLGSMIANAQQSATIVGKITDVSNDTPIEFVTIFIDGTNTFVESDINGKYTIKIPAKSKTVLKFRRIGYKEITYNCKQLEHDDRFEVNVALPPSESNVEVIIKESRVQGGGMIKENVSELRYLPTTTGNLESILPHIALGASSGTGGELSSQYNVRGGNYDENLVYVNDFEIYRPQLIRQGQQEGLTFANMDLVKDLSFSSGGFQAKYGDKMSSVLDIKYKRADSLRASIAGSFLGGSAHIEGSLNIDSSHYKKFRYLVGARYKDTRYLLGSLDTKGEYTPNFTDIQAYLTYDLSRSWQLGFLGNYNRSVYKFEPSSRNTASGLVNFALQLYTVFEGQQNDDFETNLTGLSLTYLPERKKNPLFWKLLVSNYQSREQESLDISGYYKLGELDSDPGSSTFGSLISILGVGTQQQFVRNVLQTNVSNIELKGGIELQNSKNNNAVRTHFLQWSTKAQLESINDKINEWERIDSAGYSLPFNPSSLPLNYVLKTKNDLNSLRVNGYFQDTYTFRKDEKHELQISGGLRYAYWTLNSEFNLSPRAQILYKPLNWKSDISFILSGGVYYQPPFYRELRNPEGVVNKNVMAQKSIHLVSGMTWDFNWGRFSSKKFRFIMEAYYKKLSNLVSYDVENVRIRYSGKNDATGYITGIDMRINGEFVPGAESWFNLSFLRAREQLNGIEHKRREVGSATGEVVSDVPRPTDQLMSMSIFFQDYLKKNKNIKMHLNVTVGTGLPFGIPDNNVEYRNTYRFNAYHRVDIGFSFLLYDRLMMKSKKPNHFLRFSRSTWLSLEVFNLLKVSNTASNTWIKTIYNSEYAIPNYLTSRRLNVRLRIDL
ncbi:MAG: carboxypeptidase-like regulatory domain-containing protein [Saprospiraceae bacterium]|nr:carboxypeptidase-like regulatory domain-containing protein [Saprospiraceae bacterium]